MFEITKKELQRINLVGVSGSGKSSLAKKLTALLGHKYIQLDGLYHEANWIEVDIPIFRERLKKEISDDDHWIIDGNYHSKVHDIKWEQATLVVWIDLPFLQTMRQAISRAVQRAWKKEGLWGTGNRETFRRSFFSRKSVVLWTMTSYSRVRKRYQKIMQDPQWSYMQFIRLKNHKDIDAFLEHVKTL